MDIKHDLSKIAKTVGNGAANAAGAVAKKSESFMEISKLSLKLTSEEDNITATYEKIGEVIYKKYKSGEKFSSDIEENCKTISKSNEIIDDLKEKINKLKDIKVCPNCKAKIRKDASYCPNCGTKQ